MKHKHYRIEALAVFKKGETHDHTHDRNAC
jgi:hypothetical protein